MTSRYNSVEYDSVRIGTPVIVKVYGSSRVERGVVHDMVDLADSIDAIKSVRVGHDEDVVAGGGVILKVPRDASVLSIIPPKRKSIKREVKLVVEIEFDGGIDEQAIADDVREHMQEVFDSWDYAEVGDDSVDLCITMLYFDDYDNLEWND